MVKKGLLLLLIIGIVLSVAILLSNARNKDIRQIQKNLKTITSLIEKEAGETFLVCMGKIQKFASFFMENCQVDIGSPVSNMVDRDELMGTFSQICKLTNTIEVHLSEISIDLESETSARSNFIATAIVSSSLIEKESVYPRQLAVEWEKIEGNWKIKKIEVIEILH